jgi:hypothetical protein
MTVGTFPLCSLLRLPHVALLLVALLLSMVSSSDAFVTSPKSLVPQQRNQAIATTLFGLFGQDGNNVFDNILGSSAPANPRTILEIPTKDVKVGSLRFLLQILLVGEQNKPDPKSWVTRPGDDSGTLEVYYQDGSGMFSIQLQDYSITVKRHGARPTLQYQLQESVLLHTVLDELRSVAFGVEDDNIDDDKRLLILQDNNAIDLAQSNLPARQG